MKATILGISAIIIWGAFTALIRSVTESFGVSLGAAMIYSVASLILMATQGIPKISRFPKRYLLWGALLFIGYEVFLSLSVGLAKDRYQSLEISLINYLWPTLIVLFSLWINQVRLSWIAIPGIGLAFFGVLWALMGDSGFDVKGFAANIAENPVPYTLVFIAAILWGIYCNISKRYGDGQNGVPLFFGGVALALWLKFLIGDEMLILPDTPRPYIEMIVAGVIIGSSYSFWEYGIQHGNMIVLATLSYFTPLLSILFSSIWLEVTPTMNFWLGAIMVTLGSFLAYLSTRKYSARQ